MHQLVSGPRKVLDQGHGWVPTTRGIYKVLEIVTIHILTFTYGGHRRNFQESNALLDNVGLLLSHPPEKQIESVRVPFFCEFDGILPTYFLSPLAGGNTGELVPLLCFHRKHYNEQLQRNDSAGNTPYRRLASCLQS